MASRLSKMGLVQVASNREKRFEKGVDRVTLICYSIIVDRVTRRRQDDTQRHDTMKGRDARHATPRRYTRQAMKEGFPAGPD